VYVYAMLGVISGHPASRRCDRVCSVHPIQQTFPEHAGWTGCCHWPILPRTQARSAPLLSELSSLLYTMIRTKSFLYEMLCIGGVFEICHESDFLSRSEVDDILSFLACE